MDKFRLFSVRAINILSHRFIITESKIVSLKRSPILIRVHMSYIKLGKTFEALPFLHNSVLTRATPGRFLVIYKLILDFGELWRNLVNFGEIW